MSIENRPHVNSTLLIYLPCYLDFRLAVEQAIRIRKLTTECNSKITFKILTLISVNGVDLSESEVAQIEEATDYQVFHPFGISGDVNITQGFMHAIRLQADYLWILSSNDAVVENFFETIQQNLIEVTEADVLVGCVSKDLGIRIVNSVFDLENRDIPFGLISAVIYRTKRTANNFDIAVQLNWTGWGQLATIEASCMSLNGLSVSLVKENTLYFRSTRVFDDSTKESDRIRNLYAHSFFGMPIVISVLFAQDSIKRTELLDGWVRANWYLVNYFINTDFKLWSSHVASNQFWLRDFAFSAMGHASPSHRLLFKLSKTINIKRFEKYKLARKMQSYFRSKN
jgi:hypothetical protein